jgi:SAM-dependent methyltransferase
MCQAKAMRSLITNDAKRPARQRVMVAHLIVSMVKGVAITFSLFGSLAPPKRDSGASPYQKRGLSSPHRPQQNFLEERLKLGNGWRSVSLNRSYMNLSRKLQKIATGEAWASGVDRYYRWKHPLTVDSLLEKVDRPKLNQICEKYHVPGEIKAWPKYANYEHWLGRAVDHVRELRLDRDPRLNILDIGSGAGYFLFVLKQLGHRVFGLDLAEPEFYGELFPLFGIERVIWRIEAFEPLPDVGRRFDLVTAFAICFNGHGSGKVWARKEWEFFLNDLQSRYLNPGARVFLALNPEEHGHYTPELRDFFLERGAKIDRHRIWLNC